MPDGATRGHPLRRGDQRTDDCISRKQRRFIIGWAGGEMLGLVMRYRQRLDHSVNRHAITWLAQPE